MAHAREVLAIACDKELVEILDAHVGEVDLVRDRVDERLNLGVVHQVRDDAQGVAELSFAVAGELVQNGLERALGRCAYGLCVLEITTVQLF